MANNKQPIDFGGVLEDFIATINENPKATDEELLKAFPEFNNDPQLLNTAFVYRNTKGAKKYDDATLKSKFPEFFPVQKEPQQPVVAEQPQTTEQSVEQQAGTGASSNGSQYAFMPAGAIANQQDEQQKMQQEAQLKRENNATLPGETFARNQQMNWAEQAIAGQATKPRIQIAEDGTPVFINTPQTEQEQKLVAQKAELDNKFKTGNYKSQEDLVTSVFDYALDKDPEIKKQAQAARKKADQEYQSAQQTMWAEFEKGETAKQIQNKIANLYNLNAEEQQVLQTNLQSAFDLVFAPQLQQWQNEFHNSPEYQAIYNSIDVNNYASIDEANKDLNDKLNAEFQRQYKSKMDKFSNDFTQSQSYKDVIADSRKGKMTQQQANDMLTEEILAAFNKEYEGRMQEAANKIYGDNMAGVENNINDKYHDYLVGQTRKMAQQSLDKTLPNAMNDLMYKMNHMEEISDAPMKDFPKYRIAYELLEDAKKLNDAAKKGETNNFFTEFGKGFGHSASDMDTWTFGITELGKNVHIKEVIDKWEKDPQSLSSSDKAILDAATQYMASAAYNSAALSRGYKAGTTTAASIPFMLQFIAANPAMIQGKVVEGLLGYGLEQLGKNGAGALLKETGAHILGTLAGAGAMTATFGIPTIAAGTVEKTTTPLGADFQKWTTNFEPTFFKDQQGNIVRGQGVGEAILNSTAEQFAANLSEMILTNAPLKEFFNAKLFGSIAGNPIGNTIAKVLNNPQWKAFATRAQWGGTPEEFIEEDINNILDWGMRTDTHDPNKSFLENASLTLDDQIDIFLGVAPMTIVMGGGSLAIGAINTIKDNKAIQNTIDTINTKNFSALYDKFSNAENSGVMQTAAHDLIKQVKMSDKLNNDQKKSFMEAIEHTLQATIESEVQQAAPIAAAEQVAAEIDTQTNLDDNQIHAVYIGNNQDDQAFVVGGQIAYAEDGTIDKTNSSPYVYIRKLSDNTVVSIPTKDLTSMGAPMDANQVKANAEAHAAAVAGVKQTFQVGDEIQLQGQLQNITDQSATIEDIDEDGNVTFTTDQGPVTVPADFVLANFQPAAPVQIEIPTQDQHNIVEWASEEGGKSLFGYKLTDGSWQMTDQMGNAMQGQTFTEEELTNLGLQQKVVNNDEALMGKIKSRGGRVNYGYTEDVYIKALELNKQYADEINSISSITNDDEFENAARDLDEKLPTGFSTVFDEEIGKIIIIPSEPSSYDNRTLDGTHRVWNVGDSFQAYVDGRYPELIVSKVENGKVIEAIDCEDGRIVVKDGIILDANVIQAQEKHPERVYVGEDKLWHISQEYLDEINKKPENQWGAQDKYDAATKVYGGKVVFYTNDGVRHIGRYVLTENDAVTASHNPLNGFEQSEGYPTTEDGESVNSRTYQTTDEQTHVVQNAQRLHWHEPIKQQHGIVLDGNGRKQMHDVAIEKETIGNYENDLRDQIENFGIKESDLAQFLHPLLTIEIPDGEFELTPQQLELFNQKETKGRNAIEQAILMSRILPSDVVDAIYNELSQFDDVDGFVKSKVSPAKVIDLLIASNIMPQTERVEYVNKNGDLSDSGKGFIKSLIIGTVFDEDIIRLLDQDRSLQSKITKAIPIIAENKSLGDYSIYDQIIESIRCAFEAYRYAEKISKNGVHVAKKDAFKAFEQSQTLFDNYSTFAMILAQSIIESDVKVFVEMLTLYNKQAKHEMSITKDGVSMFDQTPLLPEEIIKNLFLKEYEQEQKPRIEETKPVIQGVVPNEPEGEKGEGDENKPKTPITPPSTPPAKPATSAGEKPKTPLSTPPVAPAPGTREFFVAKYGDNEEAIRKAMRVWELTHKKKSVTPNSSSLVQKLEMQSDAVELTAEERAELINLGTELGEGFVVEDGNVKFADFFKTMVETFGDGIRPYVKRMYGGIRTTASDEIYDQMDGDDIVRAFDTNININEIGGQENETIEVREPELQPTADTDVTGGEQGTGGAISDEEDTGADGTPSGESADNTGDNQPTGTGDKGGEGSSEENGETGSKGKSGKPTGESGTGAVRTGGHRGRPRGKSNDEGATGELDSPDGGSEGTGAGNGVEGRARLEEQTYEYWKDQLKNNTDIQSLKNRRQEIQEAFKYLEADSVELATLNGELRAIHEKLRELFAKQESEKQVDYTQEKVDYVSKADPEGIHSIGSVVPSGEAELIRRAIESVEKEEGKSIAEFVKDELGYKTLDEMFSYYSEGKDTGLAGEQVDAVGLAIYQMKKGKMFIVGDMTGVGKGRTAAALIRWGKLHDKKVLFVTEKADLFSAMYADMKDIGTELLPFVTNSDVDANITDNDGKLVIQKPQKEEAETLYASDSDVLPKSKKYKKQYEFVMTTYSQLNTAADEENSKKKDKKIIWIKNYAKDAVVILDESHNASGDSNQGKNFRDIVKDASGVTFLSATYAKRPDNMVLYALRSTMKDMNMTEEQLINTIAQYGIPMQEIISAGLFKSGEMIRRERDFTGVVTHWLKPNDIYSKEEMEKLRYTSDRTMEIVGDIIDFQKLNVKPIIDKWNEDWKKSNEAVINAGEGTIVEFSYTPVSARVSEVLRLIVYSMKAAVTAKMAIEQIKQGKKPVIAVDNTLETYIKELDEVNYGAYFDSVLTRLLEMSLKYRRKEIKIKDGKKVSKKDGGETVYEFDSIYKEMDGTGKAIYSETVDAIDEYANDKSIEKLLLSPIDFIEQEIEKAGYKCGEITGRGYELRQDESGKFIKRKRSTDKKEQMYLFNGGTIKVPLSIDKRSNALILNTAGATGISLHASSRFGDQSPRTMIILQPAKNVSNEVQIRGRIDRTGQVHRAEYFYILSPIPAEGKITMMLRKKLASLDANSVGTENVSSNKVDAEDMDNIYGDKVVYRYLQEHNSDVNRLLEHPLRQDKYGNWIFKEGLLNQLFTDIMLLSSEDQERIISDITELYIDEVNAAIQNGVNMLSSSFMDLDAVSIDTGLFIKGYDNESISEFGHDTNIERVEVNVLKKPMDSIEIHKRMSKLGGINEDGSLDVEFAEVEVYEKVFSKANEVFEEKKTKARAALDKAAEKIKEKIKRDPSMSEDEYEMMIQNTPEYAEAESKYNSVVGTARYNTNTQLAHVKFATSNLIQGKVYLVPLTDDIGTDSPMSFGRFIGFSVKDYKPRSVKAVFAVKDSRTLIEVPLDTQYEVIKKIVNETKGDTDYGVNNIDGYSPWNESSENMKAWDSWWDKQIPKNTNRQIRFVVSGNIAQAGSALGKHKGTIITYTKRDKDTGERTLEKGMLLAEDFDPESFVIHRKPTKEDIWETGKIVLDKEHNIAVRRYNDSMIVAIGKRSDKETLSNNPIPKDEELKALLTAPFGAYSKKEMYAYVPEENIEAVLDLLYRKYGFSKEELFVMPDSTEKVDKIVPTNKPYQEVIDELSAKYSIQYQWEIPHELKKALKRYKLDLNNELLKEKIKELVQLRQAYYRKDASKQELSRLAWMYIVREQEYDENLEDKDSREEAYNKMQAMKEELEFRGSKGTVLNYKTGEVSFDEIQKLFNRLNKDKSKKEFADKVFSIVKKLGFSTVFSEKLDNNTGGHTAGNMLEYNWKYMNSGVITDQMKADTLLHEAIHTLTAYAIRSVEEGYEHLLTEDMITTVNELNSIYNAIRHDNVFNHVDGSDSYTDYGVHNVYEMLSEIGSNSLFMEDIKKVPVAVNMRSGFLSFSDKNLNPEATGKTITAYDLVMERLNEMLDNFSEKAFKEYFRGTGYGERDNKSSFVSTQKEIDQVIKETTENGTYLLTPNGNETSLDADQWAEVRTKTFKNIYGDWENDKKNCKILLNDDGEPLIQDGHVVLGPRGLDSVYSIDRKLDAANKEIEKQMAKDIELSSQGEQITKTFAEHIRARGGQIVIVPNESMLEKDGVVYNKKSTDARPTERFADSTDALETAKLQQKIESCKENLKNLAKKYKGIKRSRGFITDLADSLQSNNDGYSRFVLKDGRTLEIRVSNHNANSDNFVDKDTDINISIVIKSKASRNTFVQNDKVDLKEYVFTKKTILQSNKDILSGIAEDLSNTLETGIFANSDNAALINRSVKTEYELYGNSRCELYGWYKDGKIYLIKDKLNPETLVHEASHMLSAIMREINPKGWADIVRLCKESKALWDDVVNDPNYNLTTDDEIASEIISRYSGKRGAEKLTQAMNDAIKQDDSLANVSRARVIYNNVREALHKFWGWVTDLFHATSFKNLDEVADMYLDELLNTTQLPTPPRGGRREEQRISYPSPEVGESISEYAARIARVRDDMRIEEAVNAYMEEMAKLRGNKIGNVETGARAEYTRWIDAASPIENFQKYFKGENDIPSEQDAYNDTFLSQGRISFNQEVYERTFIRPMRNAVKAIMDSGKLNGLDVKWQNLTDEEQKKDKNRKNGQQLTPRELIGVYCQAKDVQECAEKGLPDRGAEGFTFLLGKSHEYIIEMVENVVPAEMINDLWKTIRNATSFALDYQVDNGYITPEERAIYNRDYYVPERGWTERDFAAIESTYYQFGKYYNQPYNKALRRARGRKSLASDPFGYIWNIADSTINSVEKNKTKVKLLEYCLEHEQEGAEAGAFRVAKFWVLKNLDENGDPIMTSQEDPVTGELVQVPSTSISYAEPTADMFRHDQELRDEIEKKERKFTKLSKEKAQWQKVADDINTNDLIREVANNKIADYETKLETLGKEIEDLRDKIQILSTKEYEGLPMLTNDEDKQHRVYAIKDGQKYELWFKDARIAQAINKDYDKWTAANNAITKAARQATRVLSAALTQYNPEFAASNFARDYQVALVSIAAEKGAEWEKEFIKQFNTPQLQAAVWAYAAYDKILNETSFTDTKYGEYLNEYFSHGAQTGFSFLKNLDVMQQDFNNMINENNAKKYAKATLGTLSMLTEVSETSIRFAGYVTAREKGMSADEAAIFAKELTINFDRGGELSKSSLMAMWSFFRATINGNLKFIKGFKNFAKGYGIAAAAYFVMGALNALCNPDDPEDEIYFSNYVRMSNFVTGKLFGITAKLPVAHFLRMFFAMGNNITQYGLGRKSGEQAMYDTVLFCGDELLPNWLNVTNFIEYDPRSNNASLNGKQYVQTAMPTPIAPIVDNALNIDFTGRAIDGRSYYYPTEANHKPILQYRKDAPEWIVKMCQGLYTGIGGDLKVNNISDDNALQRMLDNSPSKVQHFIEGYRPPFLDLVFASGALINKAADEDVKISINDIPFLRKFYSEYNPDRFYANEYWMLAGRVDSYEQLLKDTREGNRTKYYEMTKSDEYKVYQKAQRELNRQGKKAKSTPENIKNLMNLNIEWNKAY